MIPDKWEYFYSNDVILDWLPVCAECGAKIIPALKPIKRGYSIHWLCPNPKCDCLLEFGEAFYRRDSHEWMTEVCEKLDDMFKCAKIAFERSKNPSPWAGKTGEKEKQVPEGT